MPFRPCATFEFSSGQALTERQARGTTAAISASPSTTKERVRDTLEEMGVELLDGRFLDFPDPWGNRVEITTYTRIQFTKADHVLRGMGLSHLKKEEAALAELRAKGMGPW